MGNNNKSDISYIFKHGQVNYYAADYILNHPDALKLLLPFWTELQDSDFKTATEFNVCNGRKLRMDQEYSSDAAIMT
jgi:hypothetical protein